MKVSSEVRRFGEILFVLKLSTSSIFIFIIKCVILFFFFYSFFFFFFAYFGLKLKFGSENFNIKNSAEDWR